MTSPLRRAGAVIAGVLAVGSVLAGCGGISLSGGTSTTVSSRTVQIAQLFRSGLRYQKLGKLEQARRDYVKILKVDPLNEYAYYDLGVIYQDVGRTSEAAAAYEKCLLINPNYQPALFNLAVVYTRTNPTSAAVLYQRLEQLSPTNASAYFNLGLLFIHLGNHVGGVQQLEKALSIDPSLRSRLPQGVNVPSAAAISGAVTSG
jgi:tetratricopeptide (TPR) repeat protein